MDDGFKIGEESMMKTLMVVIRHTRLIVED